jgi:hypothetical protein
MVPAQLSGKREKKRKKEKNPDRCILPKKNSVSESDA